MIDGDPEGFGLIRPEELPADHRSGFVAVVGRPNVGKSTLLNAYLGQKLAIVSDKPQTTRKRMLGILTRPEAQIVFVDTPGIHKPLHKLGDFMVESAVQALNDADVILFLVDLTFPPGKEDRLVALAVQAAGETHKILVLNKLDAVSKQEYQERRTAYDALVKTDEQIAISATRGDNREELLQRIITALPLGPRFFPAEQVTDQQERFLAAELVREQVLHHTHQEIPYAVAVVVDEFKERSQDLTYISATILVERESHKGIIIGAGGKMLKEIGSGARKEIEEMLGRKVFLDLWVKVRPKWRSKEDELRRLGYGAPSM